MRTKASRATDLLPDAVEKWSYDPWWNVLNRYEDPYGNATIYGINAENGQVEFVYRRSAEEVDFHPVTETMTELTYTAGGNGIPAGLPEVVSGPGVLNAMRILTKYEYSVTAGELLQTVTEAFGTAKATTSTRVYDVGTMTLKRVVDERDSVTKYEYNTHDQLRKTILPSPGAGDPRPYWEYTYSQGAIQRVFDPKRNETLYEGNANFKTVNSPLESPSAYRYFYQVSILQGKITWFNERGVGTTYAYYPDGNLKEVVEATEIGAAQRKWTYHYNNRGLLDVVTDPDQERTDYYYDNRGQLIREQGPADDSGQRAETKYSYDQRGLLTGIEDPMGRRTTYQYDGLGRVTRVAEPNPNTGQSAALTTYAYDKAGNTRFVTTGAESTWAQTTEYVYDELNRLTFVKQPVPQAGASQPITEYTYYDTGELRTLKDPNGNLTTWDIDNLGQAVKETDQFGSTAYKYDKNGNRVLKTDHLGRVSSYVYDVYDRLRDEKWYSGTSAYTNNPASPDRTLHYDFNGYGDLTGGSDLSANYVYQLDRFGRPLYTAVTLPGLTNSVTLADHYDPAGNRDSLTASIGTVQDFVNTYAYDGLNRLKSVSQTGATVATKQVGFQYNLAGQLTKLNRFNSVVPNPTDPAGSLASTAYGYDGAGRLNAISHTTGLAGTIDLSWVYDAKNRVQQFHNSADTPTATFYGYDANDQLVGTAGGSPESYSYDAGGNRLSANGVTSTPGDANRLLSDGRYTYGYDAEGNLINRTETATGIVLNLEWDHRNRLTDVREWKTGQPHVIYELEYEYDVFDRRVARKETSYEFADGGEGGSHVVGTSIDAEKYIYDGDHIVYDFASTDGSPYTLSKRYLYGPAVDQLLAQENLDKLIADPDRNYWMLADNQSTVRDIVDNDGGLVEHYRYSAFGTLLEGNTSFTRYQYTGRELDPTTGLQYNGHRWYSGIIGRWLSEDPIGFSGGDTNLYRYVGNGPANATDPSGLWAIVPGSFDENGELVPSPLQQQPNWLPIPGWLWKAVAEPDASDFVMPIAGMAKKVGAKVVGRAIAGELTEHAGKELLETLPKGFDPAKGFATFEDFKSAFGAAGSGRAWHHAVEQTINSGKFSAELLHNPANLFSLPHGKGSIHARISGFYSSKVPGLTGDLTVRQWLNGKSFREQFEFGIEVMKEFGGSRYLPKHLQ